MYNKHYFDIINGLVREAGAGKILEEREMAFFITICAAREGDGKKADNMQEENIKISIIVPVYNVESYIEQCLDSIRKQTYSNLEVILIDDGSVDASASVCQRYVEEDSRFQLICQKNKGASAARNRGLDQATGEYIGFVDSDDWIEPDMYERLLKIAQKEVGTKTGKKYWEAYFGTKFRNGDSTPWCGTFVTWCFKKAGLYSLIKDIEDYGNLGYVPSYSAYANKKKIWVSANKAKAGDIIIFGSSSHVGLVKSVSGNVITTIEGNTGSTRNGEVKQKTYSLTNSWIKGVMRVIR